MTKTILGTQKDISPHVLSQQPLHLNPKLNGNPKSPKSLYEDGGYFRVYNTFEDKYGAIVGVYAGRVFTYLTRKANNEDNQANPSIYTMSVKIGMSKTKVVESLKCLICWNIIKRITTPRNQSNRYEIINKNEWKTPSKVHQIGSHKFKSVVHNMKSCIPRGGTHVYHEVVRKKTRVKKTNKENLIKEKANVDRNNFEYNNNGHKKNNLNITLRANENITANTKTNTHIPKEKDTIPYEEILTDLNSKAGTNFRYLTQAHRSKIKARWHEGNTFEDFQRVHSNRVAHWQGDSTMGQYLRPSTLYSNKFENYLNAPFPKGNGSFHHTPYKPRDNEYKGIKVSDKQTIETILPHKNKCCYCKAELTEKNKQVSAYFYSNPSEVMKLCSICVSKYPGNWTVVEESNELKVQHLKENDNRDVIEVPREIISEEC